MKIDIFIIAILVFFGAMANFTASVVRATLMIVFHIMGKHLNLPYDLASAAAGSMFAVLVYSPEQLCGVGFQMSYLAIFSLAFVMPVLKNRVSSFFLAAFSVQAGLLPYIAYVFNYVSIGSVVSNVPAVFIASLIVPAGFVLLMVSCIFSVLGLAPPEFLFGPGCTVLDILCSCLLRCNELTYMGGNLCFDVRSPSVFFLIVYYGVLFFIVSEMGQILRLRKSKKNIRAAVIIILLVGFTCSFAGYDGLDRCQLVFVDVGQGDCLHIKDGSRDVLIDGGGSANYEVGEKTLKPYLLKNGVRDIDMALVTHLHMDHYSGIKELCREFEVKKLGVYEGNRGIEEKVCRQTGLSGSSLLYLKAGDVIDVSPRCTIEILAPVGIVTGKCCPIDSENENENSLIIKVQYKGTSVLMTGDIDQEGEDILVESCGANALDCDILKVPHHGSAYSSSSEFISAVSPDAAVIQVGKNTYGHPADAAMERYRKCEIPLYRNDLSGAVGVRIKKDGTIKFMREIL